MTPARIGRIVSEIGRRAGVVVRKSEGKFASAHDLRRSFGTRWAPKVKPATLQLLMRHRSIETTLKYYVAQDADEIADELWKGFSAENQETHARGQRAPAQRMRFGNTFGTKPVPKRGQKRKRGSGERSPEPLIY